MENAKGPVLRKSQEKSQDKGEDDTPGQQLLSCPDPAARDKSDRNRRGFEHVAKASKQLVVTHSEETVHRKGNFLTLMKTESCPEQEKRPEYTAAQRPPEFTQRKH